MVLTDLRVFLVRQEAQVRQVCQDLLDPLDYPDLLGQRDHWERQDKLEHLAVKEPLETLELQETAVQQVALDRLDRVDLLVHQEVKVAQARLDVMELLDPLVQQVILVHQDLQE